MKFIFIPSMSFRIACKVAILVLLVQTASAIQLTNEYWISTNTPTANLGTLADPFDGSTAVKFDSVMNNLPTNAVIHILAGTYQTAGNLGWTAKSGQKILGSGIDNTILQLAAGSPGGAADINSYPDASNIEVCDLTADNNSNTNTHGVALFGKTHAIRRVKVINAAASSTFEVFLLQIASAYTVGPSEGNVIEECEVSNYKGGPCAAISIDGGATNWISAAVRNNRVYLSPAAPVFNVSQIAINGSYSRNSSIEGNHVNGAQIGFFGNNGGYSNVLVSCNTFLNCANGVILDNAIRQNLTFSFNNFQLAQSGVFNTEAFGFWNNGGAYYTNVVMMGNTIQFVSGPSAGNTLLDCSNIIGGRFAYNTADDRLTNSQCINCTGFNIYDNLNLAGVIFTNLAQVELPNAVVRTTATGNYTATYRDYYVGVQATSASTITLPRADGYSGKEIFVADEGSSAFPITIRGTGTDTINGAASVTLTTAYQMRKLMSDGVNWHSR